VSLGEKASVGQNTLDPITGITQLIVAVVGPRWMVSVIVSTWFPTASDHAWSVPGFGPEK
jgi:hypothetical protein